METGRCWRLLQAGLPVESRRLRGAGRRDGAGDRRRGERVLHRRRRQPGTARPRTAQIARHGGRDRCGWPGGSPSGAGRCWRSWTPTSPDKPEPPYPPHCDPRHAARRTSCPELAWLADEPDATLIRTGLHQRLRGRDRADPRRPARRLAQPGGRLGQRPPAEEPRGHRHLHRHLRARLRGHHALGPQRRPDADACATSSCWSRPPRPTTCRRETAARLGLPATAAHPQAPTHHMGLYVMASRGAVLARKPHGRLIAAERDAAAGVDASAAAGGSDMQPVYLNRVATAVPEFDVHRKFVDYRARAPGRRAVPPPVPAHGRAGADRAPLFLRRARPVAAPAGPGGPVPPRRLPRHGGADAASTRRTRSASPRAR